jgi:hypothetical protein
MLKHYGEGSEKDLGRSSKREVKAARERHNGGKTAGTGRKGPL